MSSLSTQQCQRKRKFLANWQRGPEWADMNNPIWLLQHLSLQNLHGEGFSWFFSSRNMNVSNVMIKFYRNPILLAASWFHRDWWGLWKWRCLWVQLSCLMPPLPRNIQIATQISHPLYPTEQSNSENQFTPAAIKTVSHFIQNSQTSQSAHISTPTV